jgi:hypothetical protein
MYVIIETEISYPYTYGYIVGFYSPDGQFYEHERFEDKRDAEKKVHYLNGGK